MRVASLICFAMLSLGNVNAQIQEKKLLDRLLKPDMSLQNSQQDKQFVAGGATLEKKARTRTFYVPERAPQKQFRTTRTVASREFATTTSRHERSEATLKPRNRVPNVEVAYSTAAYSGARPARDAAKTVNGTTYPGTRPFLVRGKSQKSLSTQNPPLTIDQVRELLNKNE